MVGPEAKRETAVRLTEGLYGECESRASRVVSLARSTKRYRPKENVLNKEIRKKLKELSEKKKRFGSPRLHQLLLSEGYKVNHKRTERLYKLEGLSLRRTRRRKTYKSEARGSLTSATRKNQYWAMDFISDQLVNGLRWRGLTLVDIFTRESLVIEVGRSLPAVRVVEVLERVKLTKGLPEGIVLDNGPEMRSLVLDEWAYRNKVRLEFIEPGKPVQNAFIESFNGTFRDECLNMHWFYNLEDVRRKVEEWRREYNEDNPHSSLGYLTPKEFAKKEKIMLTA